MQSAFRDFSESNVYILYQNKPDELEHGVTNK